MPQGDRAAKRAQWKQQIEEEDARKEWLVPLIVLGVCSVVWLLAGLIIGGVEEMALMGQGFVIQVVVNAVVGVVAAYMTVGLFGASFGNFGPAVLKLAAASTAAGTATLVIPIGGCIALVIYIGVLVIAVQMLLDLDEGDAKWFTAFFILVQVAAVGLLLYYAGDYFAV